MQKAWVYLAHIFSSYPNDLFFRSNFELIFAFISFDLRGGYFNYFLLCHVNKFAFVAEIRNFYGAAAIFKRQMNSIRNFPSGARGPQGRDGPRGRRGRPGYIGKPGKTGPPGARGRQGPRGKPGSALAGNTSRLFQDIGNMGLFCCLHHVLRSV